jgi:Zn-dependent M28 family amino/carboxypeptidase
MRQPEGPCYSVEPAVGGRIMYERLRPPQPTSPSLRAATVAPSANVFSDALKTFASLHSRLSGSEGYRSAAEYSRGKFEERGYAASLQSFSVPGHGETQNVIARKTGAAGPPAVIVTAHLDSINHDGGPTGAAPGADDNASGSAGVIAIADALASETYADRMLFVLFGGEEQGLFGSKWFVEKRDHFEPGALKAVINMDMIGSINPPEDPAATRLAVLLEGAEISRSIVDKLAAAAAAHTRLEVSVSFNPFASDHVPFIEAGLPGLLTIEGEDRTNQNVHSDKDKLDYIDSELAMEILKMNTAAVSDILNGNGGA